MHSNPKTIFFVECVLNKTGLEQEISSVVFCVAFIFSCIFLSLFWLGLIEHHSL